jgi:hypothetical protein
MKLVFANELNESVKKPLGGAEVVLAQWKLMVSGPTVVVGAVARSKFPDPAPVVTVSFVGMSVPETVIPDSPTAGGKLAGTEVPVVTRQLGEQDELTSTLVTVSVSVPQV